MFVFFFLAHLDRELWRSLEISAHSLLCSEQAKIKQNLSLEHPLPGLFGEVVALTWKMWNRREGRVGYAIAVTEAYPQLQHKITQSLRRCGRP